MSWRVGSPCRRFSIFQGAQGRKGLLILKTFLVFPRDVPLCLWSSSLQIRRCWREDKILLAVTFSLQGSASGEGQAEATSPRTPLGSSGSSTDGSFSKCLTWSYSIFLAYLRLGNLVVFTVSLAFVCVFNILFVASARGDPVHELSWFCISSWKSNCIVLLTKYNDFLSALTPSTFKHFNTVDYAPIWLKLHGLLLFDPRISFFLFVTKMKLSDYITSCILESHREHLRNTSLPGLLMYLAWSWAWASGFNF